MGSNLSTETANENQQLEKQNNYSNNSRVYKKVEHRRDLLSNNVSHVTNQEMVNFQRHSKLENSSAVQNLKQNENFISSNLKQASEKEKLNPTSHMQDIKYYPEKSQSPDNSSNSTTIITAQQLLYTEAKRKHGNRNSSKSENKNASLPNDNMNRADYSASVRKTIPPDLQLVLISANDLQVSVSIFKSKQIFRQK